VTRLVIAAIVLPAFAIGITLGYFAAFAIAGRRPADRREDFPCYGV